MFQLIDCKVEIDPNILAIPAFKTIWDIDKSKDKSQAYSELSYIFYLIDFKSPYAMYDIEKRKELIKKDILKDDKFKESKEVKEAIIKYRELSITPTMELLEEMKSTVKKYKDYFAGVNFSKGKIKNGVEEQVSDPLDVIKTADGIPKIIDAIYKLEEKVKKEISEKSSVRGKKELTPYSEPR